VPREEAKTQVDSFDYAVRESCALKGERRMKTILLYMWGVFLAAINGVGTFSGISMLLHYFDTRIATVVMVLSPVSGMHSMLNENFASTTGFGLTIFSFAVALWTFERWRQRQQQINTDRKS
jgi:hypothetical protein